MPTNSSDLQVTPVCVFIPLYLTLMLQFEFLALSTPRPSTPFSYQPLITVSNTPPSIL